VFQLPIQSKDFVKMNQTPLRKHAKDLKFPKRVRAKFEVGQQMEKSRHTEQCTFVLNFRPKKIVPVLCSTGVLGPWYGWPEHT